MNQGVGRIGFWASALCAVHCALTGILVALAPLLVPHWLHDVRVEGALLSVTVVFGGYSAIVGYRRHRRSWPAFLLLAGLAGVSLGALLAHQGARHEVSPPGIGLSLAGGVLLVSFYIVNARLATRCGCPACSPVQEAAAHEQRVREV